MTQPLKKPLANWSEAGYRLPSRNQLVSAKQEHFFYAMKNIYASKGSLVDRSYIIHSATDSCPATRSKPASAVFTVFYVISRLNRLC